MVGLMPEMLMVNVKLVNPNAVPVIHHQIIVFSAQEKESHHQVVQFHHQKPNQLKLTMFQSDLLKLLRVNINVQHVLKHLEIATFVILTEAK